MGNTISCPYCDSILPTCKYDVSKMISSSNDCPVRLSMYQLFKPYIFINYKPTQTHSLLLRLEYMINEPIFYPSIRLYASDLKLWLGYQCYKYNCSCWIIKHLLWARLSWIIESKIEEIEMVQIGK